MDEIKGRSTTEEQKEPVEQTGYDSEGISIYYKEPRSNPLDNRLTIPRLRIGSVNDLELSTDTYALKGNFQLERGLKEFIRTTVTEREIPTYIIDNHNHALFAWYEARKEGKIEDGSTLIHIDTHGDEDWSPDTDVDVNSLEDVKDYASRSTIYNFMSLALRQDLVKRVVWVSPYEKSDAYSKKPNKKTTIPYERVGIGSKVIDDILKEDDPKHLIVDVDIDYFDGHLYDTDVLFRARDSNDIHELITGDMAGIKKVVRKAGAVTMATSPKFIDQQQAVELIRQIAS